MDSLFSQNWHLFSPNPGISFTRLAVSCHAQPWIDPLLEYQNRHDVTRILAYGKVLAIYEDNFLEIKKFYSEELRKCHIENCKPALFQDRIRKNKVVEKIRKYADSYCGSTVTFQQTNSIKLLEFFPKKYSDRSSSLPWSKIVEYSL